MATFIEGTRPGEKLYVETFNGSHCGPAAFALWMTDEEAEKKLRNYGPYLRGFQLILVDTALINELQGFCAEKMEEISALQDRIDQLENENAELTASITGDDRESEKQ